MDACARETTIINPHEFGYIPLNIALEIPDNAWVLLAVRSSTHKLGLIPANGIGIGDSDFNGDHDEYKLIVFNVRNIPVTVEKGSRIAQFMVGNYEKIELEEVDRLNNENRGGIGSTGF